MRQVDLLGGGPSPGEAGQVEKLTGHLNARMEELVEDGLTVACEMQDGVGKIAIAFPRRDSENAVRQLASYGIAATEEVDRVVFMVTARVTHEDLDYVQGAVMDLLYG